MSRPEIPLDELGFPVPQGFEDEPSRRRWRLTRKERGRTGGPGRKLLAGLVVVGLLVAICWPQIKERALPWVADWYKDRGARRFFDQDDAAGAISDLDRAVALAPNDADAYLLRGLVRINSGADEQGYQQALDDINAALKLAPNSSFATMLRSLALQQLGHHKEAIAAANQYVQLAEPGEERCSALNFRAYARARAGLELDEALKDVNEAIQSASRPNEAFLDTRGYIYHLMGKQEDALVDIDEAVRQGKIRRELVGLRIFQQGAVGRSYPQRQNDEALAVMYYHRGLVHEALGHEARAKSDKQHGLALGYNPAQGVW